MNLPAILASDLHLTSNPADEYRWKLLPWLATQIARAEAKTLVLCGDLTDAKDYHPSELVNRVVQGIECLSWLGCEIIILRGNHDYLRDGHMFFEFLKAIKGVRVITSIYDDMLDDPKGPPALYLPFTRSPTKDWAELSFTEFAYVFMHQTAPGSVASNGQKMDGDVLPDFGHARVYSGDIHVPQVIGGITYIGSPYHVKFGDNFKPRVIELDRTGKEFDLHFPSPRRVMLDVTGVVTFLEALEGLQDADQVKVRVALPEMDKHRWKAIKADIESLCTKESIDLVSIELRVQRSLERARPGDRPAALFDPVEAAYSYVMSQGLGHELLDAALECMEAK